MLESSPGGVGAGELALPPRLRFRAFSCSIEKTYLIPADPNSTLFSFGGEVPYKELGDEWDYWGTSVEQPSSVGRAVDVHHVLLWSLSSFCC